MRTRFMRTRQSALFLAHVILASLVCGPTCASAAPAHFWITDDNVTPHGPNTATSISIEEGNVGTLYIWARAETGKKLRNISLNLVAEQAGVDFINGSFTMHNDAGGGRQRYEYTSDSSSFPAIESEESLFDVRFNSQTDAIEDLQGFSITDSSSLVRGVGGVCVGAETGCVTAGDGLPAWLIATVTYNAVVGGPNTDLHLQIGDNGINHESLVPGDYDYNGVVDMDDFTEAENTFGSTTDLWADGNDNGIVDAADFTIWQDNLGTVSVFESSSLASVIFGADTSDDGEPTYNGANDQVTTLATDDPDATITITAPLSALETIPEPSAICLTAITLAYVSQIPVFARSRG